jgi:hypothetical protein
MNLSINKIVTLQQNEAINHLYEIMLDQYAFDCNLSHEFSFHAAYQEMIS